VPKEGGEGIPPTIWWGEGYSCPGCRAPEGQTSWGKEDRTLKEKSGANSVAGWEKAPVLGWVSREGGGWETVNGVPEKKKKKTRRARSAASLGQVCFLGGKERRGVAQQATGGGQKGNPG